MPSPNFLQINDGPRLEEALDRPNEHARSNSGRRAKGTVTGLYGERVNAAVRSVLQCTALRGACSLAQVVQQWSPSSFRGRYILPVVVG